MFDLYLKENYIKERTDDNKINNMSCVDYHILAISLFKQTCKLGLNIFGHLPNKKNLASVEIKQGVIFCTFKHILNHTYDNQTVLT